MQTGGNVYEFCLQFYAILLFHPGKFLSIYHETLLLFLYFLIKIVTFGEKQARKPGTTVFVMNYLNLLI